MFEIGLFYSINMCLICDSYLLIYILFSFDKHINKCSRAQGAIEQNCARSNFHYHLTFVC